MKLMVFALAKDETELQSLIDVLRKLTSKREDPMHVMVDEECTCIWIRSLQWSMMEEIVMSMLEDVDFDWELM